MRVLEAKQLGLKLLANVYDFINKRTFGYTSASFSGRMPCIEISDSIIQTGRKTLERANDFVRSNPAWNTMPDNSDKNNIIYGDTDSLFVHIPGKSKSSAFDIGLDIADAISKMNPYPVKLKFEKVYLPCILQAKKRYVGFKYENKFDKEPSFDAKGIETVRRDGCPLVSKSIENSLKILFRTLDLSQVKEYLVSEWTKILNGKINIKDFIFSKEVKLGTYK